MGTEKPSPADELARAAVEKLLEEGLIPERRKDAVTKGLSTGSATEGDWRSWIFSAEVDNEREEVDGDAEEAS